MIAPVPVNRFARFAANATVPGVLSALIIQVLNRERLARKGLDPKRPLTSLRVGSELRRFLSSAESPADKTGLLKQLAHDALGISAHVRRRRNGKVKTERVFPQRLTQWLEYEAGEECDRQFAELRDPAKRGQTPRFFRPEPLISFREVDEPTEFIVSTKYIEVQGDLARSK